MIADSGNRRTFTTGAVRDIQEGKGRCDLLPLDVVREYMDGDMVIFNLEQFVNHKESKGNVLWLYAALNAFRQKRNWTVPNLMLEVSIHFEEGAKKYGEFNWQKGIPPRCYIDSALRHYFKWCRGDTDEPHDRAFCWNIICCIWTIKHMDELKKG